MFGKKGKGGEQGSGRRTHFGDEQEGYAFRRSRTLSGSLANSVESANAKRANLKSDRVKLHGLHSSRRSLKAGLVALLLLALVSGFLLSHSLAFANLSVPANAAQAGAPSALRNTLRDYVNGHPAEAFAISLNEQRAAEFLQTHGHPEVAGLNTSISWIGFNDTIAVDFRRPIALWQMNNETYYVDKRGVVFQHYQGPKPSLEIKDTSGYIAELARQDMLASRQFISYVGQLAGELRRIGVNPIQQVVIPPVVRQVNIYIQGRDYEIRVNTSRDPESQAQDIKHAIQYFEKQGISPEYIDVRVEGKAFYK